MWRRQDDGGCRRDGTDAEATTLILVTNTVAGRQWKRELIARTSLTEEEIGEYSGERKEIRPVTIATYQVTHHAVEGRVRASGPVRPPGTGAWSSTTRSTCCPRRCSGSPPTCRHVAGSA